MMRPILLYTGIHTGTHFAKMLLQMHSRVDFCAMDNDIVDLARQPGYAVEPPGHTRPALRVPPGGETVFGDLVLRWLRGELPTEEMVAYYGHWRSGMRLGPGVASPGRRRQAREIRRSLDEFGLRPVTKSARSRPLLHDHMRAHHVGCSYAGLQEADVVVTLRHPLLTVLSVRRIASDKDSDIWQFWHCFEHCWNLPGLHYLPIDRPADHAALLRRLGLPPEDRFLAAAEINPAINRTTEAKARGDPRRLDPELLRAKRMLIEENKLHPLLRPYWNHCRRMQFLRLFEFFGYDFSGY